MSRAGLSGWPPANAGGSDLHACPRAACFVALLTHHRSAHFWLKGHGVMLAAVVANDLEPRRCILAGRGFFRATSRTPLRRHHVALVIKLLVLFCKEENLLALYAWDLDIGHRKNLRAALMTVDERNSSTKICSLLSGDLASYIRVRICHHKFSSTDGTPCPLRMSPSSLIDASSQASE